MEQTSNSKTAVGQALYHRARKRIPGGTQLLSKRPEMLLPEQWPAYCSRAKGVEVWDVDGNRYIDMISGGIGACVLGYADPDVNTAVQAAIASASMTHLNCPEEVELADLLCDLHPWADMVRYARCGGEAMAVAARIARAYTGRDRIAFCGYHGWHDWYLAANLAETDVLDGHLLPGLQPAGVPRGLAGTMIPFRYNQAEELAQIVSTQGQQLAAVVMEPVRGSEPQPGFLERVRELASEAGAVLVFDEVTSGWRLTCGGAHLAYGVMPDIAVFAKAISNGYPMAAIIGRQEVMDAAQGSFISSTYWTERIGPTAALATIKKHRDREVAKHLIAVGDMMREGWRAAAARHKISITITGIAPLTHFSFDYPNAQAVRTLFTQMLLDRGYLATNGFYATYAHTPSIMETFARAVDEVFAELAVALTERSVERRLKGPVAHAGFARLA